MRLSQDEFVKMLCWEDQLLNNDWKVRYNANIDLKILLDSVTHPKDHRILEFGEIFKVMINDPVDVVRDKVLDALIAYLNAADADVAGGYASEICYAVVVNCLTDQPDKAQIVFMLWVELEAVNAVLDAIEDAIKTRVAQSVLPALDVMFQAISEFGSKIVPPNRLLKTLLETYDHEDQNVRASSKRLTLELCRWIGRDAVKSVLFDKMSDTMEKELDAELVNVRVAATPTRKIRSEMTELERKVATDAKRSRPSEEPPAKIPLEDDAYCFNPVDILTSLENSGFWNKVKSEEWIQRKEAVANLTKLASAMRIGPGDYTELCRILENLVVTDLSIAVRVEAVRAIGNLASGLRDTNFSSHSQILLPVLLSKFSEKEPIMEEALNVTLQAIYKARCVTLVNILSHVRAAVESEDSRVCSRTLNWVMYCITISKKTAIMAYKCYVRISLKCLNHETAEVRDAAFSVLVAIGKSVGMDLLNTSLERLDYVRRENLPQKDVEPSEMTRKENESRLEYLFRAHAITDTAWNEELVQETNRLQKMSLSGSEEQNEKHKKRTCSESVSEEQNKKRKYHHQGSEKGRRHFRKSDPNYFSDEEEDLDAWIEDVKLFRSLACKRCWTISCDCREYLELGNDFD